MLVTIVNAVSANKELACSPPPGLPFDTPFATKQDKVPAPVLASYRTLSPGGFERDANKDNADANKAGANGQADAL